jgi:sulfite oxidase
MRHRKHADMRVLDEALFNAGPPPALLATSVMTPTALFFTRSHGLVPEIPPIAWRLRVGGLVSRALTLSLDDLATQYAHHSVTTTLVCAGLRRDELLTVRPIPGELPWGLEPVSTASFTGVRLRDVLIAADVSAEAAHVGFVGLDVVERKQRRFGFGGSIPLDKALRPEVLLALEMNGEPLPAVHGGPVRVMVPGYIGARSVKWLGEIELRTEPSGNYFQAEAYRVQREVSGDDARDVRAGVALAEAPLNSAILSPEAGATVAPGRVELRGWAAGGDSTRPGLVEVSGDGGQSWSPATLDSSAGPWAWVVWHASVTLAPGNHTLMARAWDVNGRGQPETLAEVWNVKGYANNAWHRVPVEVRE